MTRIPLPFPPERVLLGPGPSTVTADVLAALAAPTIGHLDPAYLEIMDDTRSLLRRVFQTENHLTIAISGSGTAGMEACLVNLTEPGDEVIIGVHGFFGGRIAEIAERCGADVYRVEATWGEILTAEVVQEALERHPDAKLFGIVHAETSTGVHQPLEEISRVVHEAGMLFLVDAVASLGGMDVKVDEWAIDACYSGSQKCLSCPPGLAPVTFSPAALEVMDRRTTPVQSWYLDVSLLRSYWGQQRVYHHTAPINMTYALRQALANLLEEGLENSFARHRKNHEALRVGLDDLGLEYVTDHPLPMLNAIRVPDGIDEALLRRRLLDDFGIEIGAGLGPFAGKALRIGLMGASSSQRNVRLVLAALEQLMADQRRVD